MPPRRLKRLTKFFGIAIVVLAVLLSAAITFTIGWRPFIGAKSRPLTARTFERTPERIAKGKYLVTGVMGCFDCHSPADYKWPGRPPVEGRLGAGTIWPEGGGIVVPNITPDAETGAATWSDDAMARAIREGIGHDGRALFPIMPYQNYRSMSDEDLASVIAFIRTIPAVRNPLPETNIPFPLNRLIQSAPQPVNAAIPEPDKSTPAKRGAYVTQMASCIDCHTPMIRGQRISGMEFAGGTTFNTPAGVITSANITPDASGISYYDEDKFLSVIRTGRVGTRILNPTMPWFHYRNMTDQDLKDMFAYLKTVPAVHHRVDNGEPSADCKLCKGRHGAGESN